jgi:hypothetical protein
LFCSTPARLFLFLYLFLHENVSQVFQIYILSFNLEGINERIK